MFSWSVTVNDSPVEAVTLAGARITRGRQSLWDDQGPGVAFLELLTAEVLPDDWGASGYTDTYADVFAGVSVAVVVGDKVTVGDAGPTGYTDTYADVFAGSSGVRFVGYVNAVTYAPGLLSVTATDSLERLARVQVDSRPAEKDTTRARAVASAAGLDLSLEGDLEVPLVKREATSTTTGLVVMQETAQNTDAGFYAAKDGGMVWRSRKAPLPSVVHIPADAVESETLALSVELGNVYNTERVMFGDATNRQEVTVTDADSAELYGPREFSIQSQLAQASDASALAGHWLAIDSRPQWLADSVTVIALPDDATCSLLEDLELFDPVRITGFPNGAPLSEFTGLLLGYTETLDPQVWQFDLHLAQSDYLRKA